MINLDYSTYVNYVRIHESKDIYDWIDNACYSNKPTWRSEIDVLINYEKSRKHPNKVYADALYIMLPRGLTVAKKHEFIKAYMKRVHRRYGCGLLYVYKLITTERGEYIDVIAFSRFVLRKAKYDNVVKPRTIYLNRDTKQFSNADDPNAYLVHKAGDKVLDEKGKILTKRRVVARKKVRVFFFKDNKKNSEQKKKNFERFMARLKKKVLKALADILKISEEIKLYKRVKQKQLDINDNIYQKRKISSFNALVSEVNDYLFWIQDLLQMSNITLNFSYGEFEDIEREFYGLLNHFKAGFERNQKLKIDDKNFIDLRFRIGYSKITKSNWRTDSFKNLDLQEYKNNISLARSHCLRKIFNFLRFNSLGQFFDGNEIRSYGIGEQPLMKQHCLNYTRVRRNTYGY